MNNKRAIFCVSTLQNHDAKFRSRKVPPVAGTSSYLIFLSRYTFIYHTLSGFSYPGYHLSVYLTLHEVWCYTTFSVGGLIPYRCRLDAEIELNQTHTLCCATFVVHLTEVHTGILLFYQSRLAR